MNVVGWFGRGGGVVVMALGMGLLPVGSSRGSTLEPTAQSSTEASPPALAEAKPVTLAAGRVLERIDAITTSLQSTRYQHHTVVRKREGLYAWDCSGMANWILRKVAPRAYNAIGRDRPVARSYWRVISKAPTHKVKRGWRRLAHIDQVRPGDVFAWIRPPTWPKGGNTGHIGFAMAAPEPVEGIEGAYTLRIVDATSLPHQDDTRDPEGEGGFGYGTLLFMTDGKGKAWAYGWFGTRSRGVIPTDIVFGRVSA